MDVESVMEELAGRLDSIPDLRVYAWPPGSVTPPAAVVGYPADYSYDQTYQRGQDQMTIPVVVVVGRTTERTSRTALTGYVAGTGPRSVKGRLDGRGYAALDLAHVATVEFDVYEVGGVSYLAAIFDVTVVGPGRTRP